MNQITIIGITGHDADAHNVQNGALWLRFGSEERDMDGRVGTSES